MPPGAPEALQGCTNDDTNRVDNLWITVKNVPSKLRFRGCGCYARRHNPQQHSFLSTGCFPRNPRSHRRCGRTLAPVPRVVPTLCTQHACEFTSYPQSLWESRLSGVRGASSLSWYPQDGPGIGRDPRRASGWHRPWSPSHREPGAAGSPGAPHRGELPGRPVTMKGNQLLGNRAL